MSNIKTKIFIGILSATMLTSILPTTVFADSLDKTNIIKIENKNYNDIETIASGKCGKNLKWTIKDYIYNNWADADTVLTISGKGKMYNYKGAGGAPWVKYARNIDKVVISNGVTSIGNYAFAGIGEESFSYPTVSLPKSLKTIGSHAFSNSFIKSISIPKNVTSIGYGAFAYCWYLKSVTGGAGLKTIGKFAFFNSDDLNTVKITSKKLKKIGANAFKGCKKLTTLNLPNTTMLSSSGVRKSLVGSSIKTVKVKSYKVKYYKKYFKKSNSGRKVTVKKA